MTDTGESRFGFRPPWPPRSDDVASNKIAIAALVCGIISVPLFLFPAPAVAAVVLGIIGHQRSRDFGGEIMALIGATIGAVVVIVFAVLFARNFYDVTHTTTLWNVGVGTCLKEVYPERIVVRKDCSISHGSEVVGIVNHDAGPGTPYPKGFELNLDALAACHSPLAEYVGSRSDHAETLELHVQYPDEAEWSRGHRTIFCFAAARDGGSLVGSVRGSRP